MFAFAGLTDCAVPVFFLAFAAVVVIQTAMRNKRGN